MTQVAPQPHRRARRDQEAGGRGGRHGTQGTQPDQSAGEQRTDIRDASRGRHATTYNQGFARVVGWTILGTVVPGVGLLAAGRRLGGTVVLLVSCFLGAAAVAFVLVGDPITLIKQMITSPNQLIVVAAVIAIAALAWAATVVATHASLRRYAHLSSLQRVLSAALVTSLIGIGLLPAAKASQDALITRDTVVSVFSSARPTVKGAHRPNVTQADPWASTPRVNVLLIGSDSGPDRTGVRPDSMIVASINTHTGETVLFSLPRNLQHVPFPAGSPAAAAYPQGFYCLNAAGVNTECLLNALWTFGEDHPNYYPGDPLPGLTATIQGAQTVTGLQIDNYAMLNLAGFTEFVDAIGGITVNITERLPVGGSVEDPVASEWLEPGPNQHLDGYHALWFARSRWSTSDYDRMRRQRCVIGDVAKQANPAMMALNFDKIATAAKDNISTDIPLQDLGAWVTLTLRIKKSHVRSLTFTNDVIDTVNPDFDKMHALVQAAITPPSAQPTPATTATPTPGVSTSTTATPAPSPSASAGQAVDVNAVC